MSQRHYPGETLGIIGSSVASALLAQSAGKLGYRVASLVTHPDNPVRQFASWQTVVDQYDEQALKFFGGRTDVVTAEVGLLNNLDLQLLESLTDLALSENLMAMTTDRLIEKAFLDRNKFLVAPFSLITNRRDLEEAVEIIGFPAILKTTQRHVSDAQDHLMIYGPEDFPDAEAKLERGACLLEAWIPSEKVGSVTIVRNERGERLTYPVFEKLALDDEIVQVRYPANIHPVVEGEMIRISESIADLVGLSGAITVNFLITSASVVYVAGVSTGLSQEAMFTIGSTSLSHFEASVRAIMGLPLPELRISTKAAIAYPLAILDLEAVMTQLMLRTDWGFALFNSTGASERHLTGQVIVTGDSIESCERQVEITNLLAK
ncbi:ATP-grasp domain-containing protein [Hutsoniella sourekii]